MFLVSRVFAADQDRFGRPGIHVVLKVAELGDDMLPCSPERIFRLKFSPFPEGRITAPAPAYVQAEIDALFAALPADWVLTGYLAGEFEVEYGPVG